MTTEGRLPSISLVTPSLDQGRFLGEAIESVLSQGYPRLSYLVKDGGSRDGSLDVLERYRGRVEWVSGKDGGQAAALNEALGAATGEVAGFLNSDDVLLPGALRAVGEAFASDPDLVLVYGRARFVDEGGGTVGPCLTRAWDPAELAEMCLVAQPAAFFRRTAWEQLGRFDTRLHHAFDYDFWLRLAARFPEERVRYLDRELAAARLHAAAKTVGAWERGLSEVMDVVRRHTGYVSLWWCVAKWDYRLTGKSQSDAPHRVPWRALPPALAEFAARNRFRPSLLWRGLRRALRGRRPRS